MGAGGAIIAMGGGGFSMEPRNLALDAYVLSQARQRTPRVLFVGTASGDGDGYVARFHAAFAGLDCRTQHLPLFRAHGTLRETVLSHDVVYVGGGNTKSMVAVWRAWGLPELLREAWEGGTVLAGVSAGAICWFEQGVTDSVPGPLGVLDCLGFLPGSCCPHYHGEAERRPATARLLREGALRPGIAIDDFAAVHHEGGRVVGVVASRPDASAWRVAWDGSQGDVRHEPLAAVQVLEPVVPTWPTW